MPLFFLVDKNISEILKFDQNEICWGFYSIKTKKQKNIKSIIQVWLFWVKMLRQPGFVNAAYECDAVAIDDVLELVFYHCFFADDPPAGLYRIKRTRYDFTDDTVVLSSLTHLAKDIALDHLDMWE